MFIFQWLLVVLIVLLHAGRVVTPTLYPQTTSTTALAASLPLPIPQIPIPAWDAPRPTKATVAWCTSMLLCRSAHGDVPLATLTPIHLPIATPAPQELFPRTYIINPVSARAAAELAYSLTNTTLPIKRVYVTGESRLTRFITHLPDPYFTLLTAAYITLAWLWLRVWALSHLPKARLPTIVNVVDALFNRVWVHKTRVLIRLNIRRTKKSARIVVMRDSIRVFQAKDRQRRRGVASYVEVGVEAWSVPLPPTRPSSPTFTDAWTIPLPPSRPSSPVALEIASACASSLVDAWTVPLPPSRPSSPVVPETTLACLLSATPAASTTLDTIDFVPVTQLKSDILLTTSSPRVHLPSPPTTSPRAIMITIPKTPIVDDNLDSFAGSPESPITRPESPIPLSPSSARVHLPSPPITPTQPAVAMLPPSPPPRTRRVRSLFGLALDQAIQSTTR